MSKWAEWRWLASSSIHFDTEYPQNAEFKVNREGERYQGEH